MALEYSLIIAGNSSAEAFLSRVLPEADERPNFEVSGTVWIVDLREHMGFSLHLLQGVWGFFEAEADEEIWTWEPELYINLGFRFDKEFPREIAQRHLLAIVARVLATGGEDVALILNGDTLLLRREAGKLTRFHTVGFWQKLELGDFPDGTNLVA